MKKMMVDAKICTGCRRCEAICSLTHGDSAINPELARIHIRDDVYNGVDIPVVCRQCNNAPCAPACPYEAITLDSPLGNPVVHEDKCTGCMACLEACPFGAVFFDEEKRLALICDLCGGDPICVKYCRALPHIGYSAIAYTTPREWGKRRVMKPEKRAVSA